MLLRLTNGVLKFATPKNVLPRTPKFYLGWERLVVTTLYIYLYVYIYKYKYINIFPHL